MKKSCTGPTRWSAVALASVAVSLTGCMPAVDQDEAASRSDPAPASQPIAPPPSAVEVPAISRDGSISLQDYRGQVVLLDFWATWSAQSRHEQADIARLHDALSGEGFTVLGFSLDDAETTRAHIQLANLPYPIGLAQDDLVAAYGGVRAVPTRVLLDRAGRIRQSYAGAEPIALIESDVRALLAE